MASCPHVNSANISSPRPTDSVYREDCTVCFDSIDDPAGLDVCLGCFNGGCAGDRHHSEHHSVTFQHPLAVNIKRTRKRKQRDDGQPPEKITKLAISAETEGDLYDTQIDVHCFICGIHDLKREDLLGNVVDDVLKANTFAREAEVQAWQEEIIPCEHTLCLEQEPSQIIPSGDLGHCNMCDLKENLWLCLTCGNLGCGRKVFMDMGPKGNGHQLEHNSITKHPVAVKLGSLTADGHADVHCYACDEERQDPELVAHLANWGIDLSGRTKTEKSVTEMQLEHNLTYDFSMTTADGQQLKALFGPALTGLKNLGNTCYMASILQSLFSMPEFEQRYYRPSDPTSTLSKPAEDLEVQLRKVADGLLSGRYSVPDKDNSFNEAQEQAWQRGLAPSMLKHLVGKGHAEFSTMRQQDSFELLLHLLKLITRSQPQARDRYKDPSITDPVDTFRFVMEQRLQCLNCDKVRYSQDEMECLSVAVPIKRLPQPEVVMTDSDKGEVKEEFEPVTLKECLDGTTQPEQVELNCASCGGKAYTKQSKFKTFPTILAVNARRFAYINWVPTKLDVPVVVGDETIDFEPYRSKGLQPGEVELPEDQTTQPPKKSFVADEGMLDQLMAMGFPRVRCEKALHATGNANADMATTWLFEHMDDPDIDEPLDLGEGSSDGAGASGGAADPEKIENLGNMGFSAPQARQALKETGGDMERAVDWLFSHPDATGDFGEEEPARADGASDAKAKVVAEDTRPAKFSLNSIVCHKGSSIHAGHYVAFVKKKLPEKEGDGEGWVLFNDEKVALGGDVEEMKKFAYVYFFRREGA